MGSESIFFFKYCLFVFRPLLCFRAVPGDGCLQGTSYSLGPETIPAVGTAFIDSQRRAFCEALSLKLTRDEWRALNLVTSARRWRGIGMTDSSWLLDSIRSIHEEIRNA